MTNVRVLCVCDETVLDPLFATVSRPFRTVLRGLGAGFWNLGGKKEKTAKKWGKNEVKWARNGLKKVEDFRVTRWLGEGEVIPLGSGAGDDGAEGARATGLEVLHLPGHTPDSSARPPAQPTPGHNTAPCFLLC